jgi:dTDP-4-dehydrorhamnose 3,5-epimerase
LYKTTDYWAPEYERAIRWDDETIAIDWPINISVSLSGKDQVAKSLLDAEVFN